MLKLTKDRDGEVIFLLYVGSATDGKNGSRSRFKQYDKFHQFPKKVQDFIEKGWTITHQAPVLRCLIPQLNVQTICRNVVILLEGVCTFLLSALYTVRDADFGVPNIALWPSVQRNHIGLGTHSPLSESRGCLMNVLSDGQVKEILATKKASQARGHKKYRESEHGMATSK